MRVTQARAHPHLADPSGRTVRLWAREEAVIAAAMQRQRVHEHRCCRCRAVWRDDCPGCEAHAADVCRACQNCGRA